MVLPRSTDKFDYGLFPWLMMAMKLIKP